MSKDDLIELEADREIYRTLMKSLHLEISGLKAELQLKLERFQELDKEFRKIDRSIANETKVTIIQKKSSKPKGISPQMAKDLLAALGVPQDQTAQEEQEEMEVEDYVTEEDIEMLEALCGKEE